MTPRDQTDACGALRSVICVVIAAVAIGVAPDAFAQEGDTPSDAASQAESDSDAEAPSDEPDPPENEEDDDTFSEEELFEGEETEARRTDDFDTVQRRRVDQKPLSSMSVEEAQKAGFVFEDEQEKSSRTTATLLASTVGLVIHGAGHWQLEEQRTASILLATEVVGLTLAGSGLAWQALSDGSPASRIFAGPAIFAGSGLFAVSYLADIMGTVQSIELGLPQNDSRDRGVSGRAEYSFLRLDGYPGSTLQLLTLNSRADLGFGFFEVETAQDVYLDTSRYGADLGWRFWRGPGQHNFVYLAVEGDLFQFRGVGPFSRYGLTTRLGVSFDVGQMISQLRHLVVGTSVGWGRHWYQLPIGGEDDLRTAYTADLIPFEMFMSLNLNDQLNARLSYERRDGEFLQSDSRLLGMVATELTFRTGDRADLILRAEAGGGYGLTAGLRFWFWE